jgi:2-hydroxymuconate-semialdehyde hydrolase
MLRSQHEHSGGWRRYFIDTGPADDVVVFLHGIPTNHLLWRRSLEYVGPNIRAIAPDLTGFGLSDLPRDSDLSPGQQALDILAFLDRRGADHFTVVAHDFGFLVACELLVRMPQRVQGLVIANTSIRAADWSGSGLNPFRLIAQPLVGELAFGLARRWMLRLAFMPFVSDRAAFTDDLLEAMWLPFKRGFPETLLRLFRSRSVDAKSERRWLRALAAFDGPVSIVWGERDPAFQPDRAHDLLGLVPQAKMVFLTGSNHFVPIDRPRVLARVVRLQVDHMGGR